LIVPNELDNRSVSFGRSRLKFQNEVTMKLGDWARALLVFFLQSLVAAGSTQGVELCPISTLSEEIDGGRIVYNVAGTGPTVVLLHGLFANKEQWNTLSCMLADDGYRTIAVDLPGYGKSVGYPLAAYRLENQIGKLHALMSRLDIAQFDLAGNSMGGAIASLYASRYPAQVRSLAFIGSPLGVVGWTGAMHNAIYRGINPFIPINVRQLDLELQLLFVTPPSISDAEKRAIVAMYVANNRHYVQVWNIVNLYNDVLWRRPIAKLPTLIIWGIDDRIFGVNGAQRLQRAAPGSELHELPHAGHLLQVERAAEVAPIYVNFIRHQATGTLQR
jgi:abhydrolase domain-containing protein 6